MHPLPLVLVLLLHRLLLLLDEHGRSLLLLLGQLLIEAIELVPRHHERAVQHWPLLHRVHRFLLGVVTEDLDLRLLAPRAPLRRPAPRVPDERLVRLVRQADSLLCEPDHDVGVVPHPDQQAGQHDAHIEAVPGLPPQHAGGGRDVLGEGQGVPEMLVLNVLGNEEGTGLQVVDLVVLHLGGPHRCTDEFLYTTLVPWRKEQLFPMRIQLDELPTKVLDILQHQQLFVAVCTVACREILWLDSLHPQNLGRLRGSA
mmetsp:Transcript_41498/g.130755  ORF Transcript_41498/g.130755 Transcript_41498/m.130755 type:complete len:256 (-) Transcript_41498:325-1092(-)